MTSGTQDDFQIERSKADAWLSERGVEGGLEELCKDASGCPQCLPELLELLEMQYSLRTRRMIAQAIVHRKPNVAQKRRAFGVFLAILRERVGQYDVLLSSVVLNALPSFVTPERVHEVGEMTVDPRYGLIRAELTFVLRQIGNADAIAYLLRAARDPVTASLALDGLARLRAPEALMLCEEALKNPDVPAEHRYAIKATLSKLKKQALKKPGAPSHITKDAIPDGLEEWSTNLDTVDLPKVLRGVAKCVETGFGRPEISEVVAMADGLDIDQTARFKFTVGQLGKESTLWVEIFCDDENSIELYLLSGAELIRRVESEMEKLLK